MILAGVRARLRALWPGGGLAFKAFLCGAVLSLGQAPFGLWPLSLLALAAGIWLVSEASGPMRAAGVGLFLGAGHFAAALNWIVEPFLVEPEVYAWMIPFALAFLSFGLALFWALAAGLAHLARGRPLVALLFAVTLAGAELARGWVLTGFPWALIGHIWIDTAVAQWAAFGGPVALTLLATVAAALPVALWSRSRRWAVILPLGVIALAYATGAMLAARPIPEATAAVVRLVQPNAAQHLKWDPERARSFFDRQLDLTSAPPTDPMMPPDLVVWPETSVPYLFRSGDTVAQVIAGAAGVPVAVGFQRVDGPRGFNSLGVIDTQGRISATYDKHHLVPFGEYIPFGDFAYRALGLSAFAAQVGNGYSAGEGALVLDFGPKLGLALPLICYEAVFPQDLRAAPRRAGWILQITNDAWFGEVTGPYQHLAQARLRAIEQGLPFLRAANTGITAVIDARGRVVEALPMGVSGFLDVRLPAALPATIYAKTGDWPLFLLLIGLFGALLALSGRKDA